MSQQLKAVVARYCDELHRLSELLQELPPAVAAAVHATAAQQTKEQKIAEGPQQLPQRQQQEEGNREESEEEATILTPLDVAQLQMCLGFAAVSLYHSYLQTQGQDVGKHPVVRDVARVRAYMKKVAARVDEEKRGRSTSAAVQRSFSVNAAAAKRVFQFYSRRRPAS